MANEGPPQQPKQPPPEGTPQPTRPLPPAGAPGATGSPQRPGEQRERAQQTAGPLPPAGAPGAAGSPEQPGKPQPAESAKRSSDQPRFSQPPEKPMKEPAAEKSGRPAQQSVNAVPPPDKPTSPPPPAEKHSTLHGGIDEGLLAAAGHALDHLTHAPIGTIVEAGAFQLHALHQLGAANEAGRADLVHNAYKKEYADAVANLTGPNGSRYAADYAKGGALSYSQLKSLSEEASKVPLSERRNFVDGWAAVQNNVKWAAQKNALRDVSRFGQAFAEALFRANPDDKVRRQAVLKWFE